MWALEGGYESIRKGLPILILAVHSDAMEGECRALLEPLGYVFKDPRAVEGRIGSFLVRREISPRRDGTKAQRPQRHRGTKGGEAPKGANEE